MVAHLAYCFTKRLLRADPLRLLDLGNPVRVVATIEPDTPDVNAIGAWLIAQRVAISGACEEPGA
jgi:hypothetical protein